MNQAWQIARNDTPVSRPLNVNAFTLRGRVAALQYSGGSQGQKRPELMMDTKGFYYGAKTDSAT